ncbi:hypothetical protein NDU88_001568 [Pleurodeles waltl]|uniref:Secreted protein n=1 Tax=Pleurodeles waltl TaxID=8319 RepID=A0AAV7SZV3_PLEWA|nr:hypothetical protein NDU88_001568 [Pleurodeles waltl]
MTSLVALFGALFQQAVVRHTQQLNKTNFEPRPNVRRDDAPITYHNTPSKLRQKRDDAPITYHNTPSKLRQKRDDAPITYHNTPSKLPQQRAGC